MPNAGPSRLVLSGVVALLVAALGCGGGGGNGGGPTPTPSQTPTATPRGTPTAAPTPTPTATAVPNPFTIAAAIAPESNPGAGYGGGRYLATFSMVDTHSRRDLFAVRLAANGGALDSSPVLLSDLGPNSFLDPAQQPSYEDGAIGFDGSGFGVFFFGVGIVGAAGPPGEIIGFTSVPTAGDPLQPATELATQASFSKAQTSLGRPSAATSDGTRFVGLYELNFSLVGSFSVRQILDDFVTVSGRSIDSQAAYLGGATIPTMDNMLADAAPGGVANNGSATLAAWIETTANIANPQDASTALQAALIAPGQATRIRLSNATANSGLTTVASDGTGFLVVWNATTAQSPTTTSEIRAIRYVPGGGAGGEGSIEPAGGFVVASGTTAKSLGGVAFAGGTYLVAWLEDGAIRGARIAEDGTTPALFTVDPGPTNGFALTSDGERFLFVIEKPRASRADVLGLFVDANE